MGATTDQLVPVVDPANRAVRLAASVCVWDMEIPFSLLSLYGRVFILGKSTGAQYTPTQYSRRGTPGPPVHAVQLGVATWASSRPRDDTDSRIVDRRKTQTERAWERISEDGASDLSGFAAAGAHRTGISDQPSPLALARAV